MLAVLRLRPLYFIQLADYKLTSIIPNKEQVIKRNANSLDDASFSSSNLVFEF